MTLHVYVGPTLTGDDVLLAAPHAVVHRPVRHGDLLALRTGPDDTVVIIDGVSHQGAAVRHEEIIDVLARGTRVLGAAGAGALRAAELGLYGMEGVGLVFGMYSRGTLDSDDEVAVGHPSPGGRREPGLPLVNLRWTISNAIAAEALRAAEGEAVLAAARALHYTERTWDALCRTAPQPRPAPQQLPAPTEAARKLREFARRRPELSDLMRRDAHCALARSLGDRPALATATPAWMVPRTIHLERPRRAFRPAVAGRHDAVSELDVLRFQQLYAPDFPARYRRFALTRIAGPHLAAEDRGLAHAVMTAAGERGITHEALPAEAWSYWLTPQERREDSPERRLLTLLVRSFRSAPGAAPFDDAPDELRGGEEVWRASADAVAAAAGLTRRMESEGSGRSPRRAPSAPLHGHLGGIWQVDGADALDAAARDRGFLSAAEAEEAARPFFPLHGTGALPRPPTSA
ncbi:TfuA-like protein [Streptomyces sp. SH5]|uniref:TfuA-like protein n=1 Tax=Streptomyces sp. SH5 TaxID=3041765 RepID=UPI002477EFD9|nr:TfuA-like protein [Streptomyces sp. SH5]WGP09662.1 TfuA-like protein [Streptomyces sp. SH5]